MEYFKATEIIREFKKGGVDITPELTDDWVYYFIGDHLKFKSEKLGVDGKFVNLLTFTRDILLNDKYTFEGNKWIGEFALTKFGFMGKDEFNEAVELINTTYLDVFDRQSMTSGCIYKDIKGDEYLFYIGKVYSESIFLQYHDSIRYKINDFNNYLIPKIYPETKAYTKQIKLIDERIPSPEEFNEIITEAMFHHRFLYIDIDEHEKDMIEIENENSKLLKYKNDYFVIYRYGNIGFENTIHITSDVSGGVSYNLRKIKNIKSFLFDLQYGEIDPLDFEQKHFDRDQYVIQDNIQKFKNISFTNILK